MTSPVETVYQSWVGNGNVSPDIAWGKEAILATGETVTGRLITDYIGGPEYSVAPEGTGHKSFPCTVEFDSGSLGYWLCATNSFGNADPSDVVNGKTFTVDTGTKTGTHVCPTLESMTADATAGADDIASGKTAYVNGELVTGSLEAQNLVCGITSKIASLTKTLTIKDLIGCSNFVVWAYHMPYSSDYRTTAAMSCFDGRYVAVTVNEDLYTSNLMWEGDPSLCHDYLTSDMSFDPSTGTITNCTYFGAVEYYYVGW